MISRLRQWASRRYGVAQDPGEEFRLLAWGLLLCVAVLMVPVYLVLGSALEVLILGAFLVSGVGVFEVYRLTRSPALFGHLVLFVGGGALTALTLSESPVDPAMLAWLAPAPPLAAFLVGWRGGVTWLVVSVLSVVAVLALDASGLQLGAPPMHPVPMRIARLASLVVVIFGLSVLFDVLKERANEARARFFASMSHELRTPMNGIVGLAESLHSELKDDTQRERMADLLRSSQALGALFDDLLDLSRLDVKAVSLDQRPFSLGPFVDALGDRAKLLGSGRGVRVVVERPSAVVRGDARRVRQVLVALVEERLLRMTSGTLALRCVEGATEGQWRFELSPEGPLRERPASAGLPLALELARLLGARVEGVSGEGVVSAVFTLPPESMPATVAAPRRGLRVLAVDDNAINLKVLTSLLGKYHCVVETAGDGGPALEVLREHRFDLVLMDCDMPGLDGLATTRALRARGDFTPVVAVTATASEEQHQRCLAAGMQHSMAKPVTLEALGVVLRTWASS